ncbi:erythromycin esterase family protein [Marinicella gelatinilytica]|uniref:erythromycin esterase family protein n=1 Tax=Marinicella gelatinilytica TaxID=2996017 RepID=UPI00389910B5
MAEQGFSFIAVEGGFASLYHLNRYVKNLDGAADSAKDVLLKLDRWPTILHYKPPRNTRKEWN